MSVLVMRPQPQIPHKPQEWEVVHFHKSAQHQRDALVLCVKDREAQIPEFVVWYANMIEGGCHNGYYSIFYDKAKTNYAERIREMN